MSKQTLDRLYYDVGRQWTNFYVMIRTPDYCSKWRDYLRAQEDPAFMERVTDRTMLNNEGVLDIDPERWMTKEDFHKRVNEVVRELKRTVQSFKVYHTGSRGVHIHYLWRELAFMTRQERERARLDIITRYGADAHKASDKAMILLEGAINPKTGKQKRLILEV